MLTIAHRHAVDRARESPFRLAANSVRWVDFPSENQGFEDGDELQIGVEHERARNSLRRLTGDQRRVLSLAYWDALTTEEIADRVGVSVETVKIRILEGLRHLRLLADSSV